MDLCLCLQPFWLMKVVKCIVSVGDVFEVVTYKMPIILLLKYN